MATLNNTLKRGGGGDVTQSAGDLTNQKMHLPVFYYIRLSGFALLQKKFPNNSFRANKRWRLYLPTTAALKLILKGNGKVHPRTGLVGPEGEYRYSSTLSLTSALEGGGWSMPRPGRSTPGKTRYPLYRRLGGPQGRSRRLWKISPPPGFDPRTVQPVASRYTDWAIPDRSS